MQQIEGNHWRGIDEFERLNQTEEDEFDVIFFQLDI
jgi:hypothetical protein